MNGPRPTRALQRPRLRPRPPEEPRDLVERPLRRRQTDALQRPPGQRLEPLERQRQVRAALGRDQRVDLIDDHRLDRAQPLPRVRGEQQVQRLRRGDQDVGRIAGEPRALRRRRVAAPHRDRRDPVQRRRGRPPTRRCRRAARAGSAPRPPPAPSAARRRGRGSRSCLGGSGANISRSMQERNAASVLPLPVGARSSVDSPRRDRRPGPAPAPASARRRTPRTTPGPRDGTAARTEDPDGAMRT